jgi:hypothetical protein
MEFNSSVTDGTYILFIKVGMIEYDNPCRPVLDIKLTGQDHKRNIIQINKAMSELLVRKANVFTLQHEQATSETCLVCKSLIKQAAQELIREGNFDLLFW